MHCTSRKRIAPLLLLFALSSACTGATREPESLPLPALSWRVESSTELPGPLASRGPVLLDGVACLPTADGLGCVDVSGPPHSVAGPAAALDEPAPLSERWSVAADGKHRARIDERGRLELQRACRRCRRGWKTRWRLRLPATAEAPPVVGEEQVYVGLLDNRLYAVRLLNGHRAWDVDVGARVRRESALLSEAAAGTETLLLVPGAGQRLLMLAGRDGSTRYEWTPAEQATIVGSPLPLPDGRVAVALQGYESASARLSLFVLVSPGADLPAPDGL